LLEERVLQREEKDKKGCQNSVHMATFMLTYTSRRLKMFPDNFKERWLSSCKFGGNNLTCFEVIQLFVSRGCGDGLRLKIFFGRYFYN